MSKNKPLLQYSTVTCCNCGKEFVLPCNIEEWPFKGVYHSKYKRIFCKYSCKSAYDKTHERKRKSVYYDFLN